MTTESATTPVSVTEQNHIEGLLLVMSIPELFNFVNQHLTHTDLMKLVHLSTGFRKLLNRYTWGSIVTSDQESRAAIARKNRGVSKSDQASEMTLPKNIKSKVDTMRYVPESILKNPGRYSWVKSEYILTIDMYKCSNLDKELFTPAKLKPYCNIQRISIHTVSVIVEEPGLVYMMPIHADAFHSRLYNIFQGESGSDVKYGMEPSSRVLQYSENRLSSETYETVITNTNYTALKDYKSVTGLTAYYIDMTRKMSDIYDNIDLFVNLKRLTFYPSEDLSLKCYEDFLKSLSRLPCLEDLKTSHILSYLKQNYTACRYAPQHLKSYEIKVHILSSCLNIQQINSITGYIPQVTSVVLSPANSQSDFDDLFLDRVFDLLPMLTSMRKLLYSRLCFSLNTPTITIPYASKLVSLTIEAYAHNDLFLFIQILHQLTSLKALSVKSFPKKSYSGEPRLLKRRLINPVFQSLQQFIQKLNRGNISIDDINEAELDYSYLWDQIEKSQKDERLSWSEEDLKDVFGVLLYPKTLLQKTRRKGVLKNSYMYIMLDNGLASDIQVDWRDSRQIICYQAICEAFSEEIFKLPNIQYVQITGYQIALEAPRFQKLLQHPTLETIEVTEDVNRAVETLNELWYAEHLTKVDSQMFHHREHMTTLSKIANTYEVDVESIRKGYRVYDGFISQNVGREAGPRWSDMSLYEYLIQTPNARV